METANKDQKSKHSHNPTALVAGGAGFLGSYLCEALVTQGFNVLCVDNLATSSKDNIHSLISTPNFTFWQEDITRPGFTISPTIKLDYIFHLAGTQEYLSGRSLLQTLLVNSHGTKNLLDLAAAREAKFILVSSAEVFHAALSQTNLNNYFAEKVESAELSFAEAKRFAESLTGQYLRQNKLKSLIVRIKDPYGPRMSLSTGNSLANIINQAVSKEKIEIAGDGLKTLNPTFVTDIVFGVIKAALVGEEGEIFNLINPEQYTERAIAEHLSRILGNLEIVYKKGQGLDFPDYPLFLNKAQNKLSWTPKISLPEGLSQTATYFKSPKEEREEKEPLPVLMENEAKKPTQRRSKKKSWFPRLILLFSVITLLWLIALPIGLLGINNYSADKNMEKALQSFQTEDTSQASTAASRAESSYKAGQGAVDKLVWIAQLVGLKSKATETENKLFYSENLAAAAKYTALSLESINKVASGSSENLDSDLESARLNINLAQRSFGIATSLKVKDENLQQNERILRDLIATLDESLSTLF